MKCSRILHNYIYRYKTFHKTSKKERLIFKYAKMYLKNGLFIFKKDRIDNITFRDISLRDLPLLHYNIQKSAVGGITNIFNFIPKSNIKYAYGEGKYIFFIDNFAVAYYKEERLYKIAKSNFFHNCAHTNYPIPKIYLFDDIGKKCIMEKVDGRHYDDDIHDAATIDLLFKYGETSPLLLDEIKYLQHGDVKRENIIWTEPGQPYFIDLDRFSYYPMFLDVLYFCNKLQMNINDIYSVFNNHIESVKKIFGRLGVPFDNNYFDVILSQYVDHFIKMGNWYSCFSFADKENTKEFKKTNKLLQEFSN